MAEWLALFQKRLAGDDALLELARLRFEEAGLGAEIHAASPEEFDYHEAFRPRNNKPTVIHLPRDWDAFDADDLQAFRRLVHHTAGRVYGFVLHDQKAAAPTPQAYGTALRRWGDALTEVAPASTLFLEYAAGLDPREFVDILRSITDHPRVSACLDTGHLGIWQTRQAYAERFPGEDICDLDPDRPELENQIDAVRSATESALPKLLDVIRETAHVTQPLHFHLHDGHPLARSPYGVSDHRSFLACVRLPFFDQNRRSLSPLFGPRGLQAVIRTAQRHVPDNQLSFTLEIHETNARLPLEQAGSLFSHWTDRTHAERMNHWLVTLQEQAELCRSGLSSLASE